MSGPSETNLQHSSLILSGKHGAGSGSRASPTTPAMSRAGPAPGNGHLPGDGYELRMGQDMSLGMARPWWGPWPSRAGLWGTGNWPFCSIAVAGSGGYKGLTQYAGLLVAQFLISVRSENHAGVSVWEYGKGIPLLRPDEVQISLAVMVFQKSGCDKTSRSMFCTIITGTSISARRIQKSYLCSTNVFIDEKVQLL